jgi:hypothetical protein
VSITRGEWLGRCQAEYERHGVDEDSAAQWAQATTEAVYEDGTADDYSPEDAARDDMECWEP